MARFYLDPLDGFDPVTEVDLDELGILAKTKEQHANKHAALFAGVLDGERVGTLVLRLEQKPSGKLEMVIVAAMARGSVAVLMDAVRDIEDMARGNGCTSIRLHTIRPGLMRTMMRERPEGEATYWYEV